MLSAVFIPTAPRERAPSPVCSGGLRHMVAHAESLQLTRELKTSFWRQKGPQHCPLISWILLYWEDEAGSAGNHGDAIWPGAEG